MGDDHHRQSLARQIPNHRLHLPDHGGIQGGGRLIKEDDFRWGNRLKDWNTMPIVRRPLLISHFLSVMHCPFTMISPEMGVSSIFRQRIRVDLTVPFCRFPFLYVKIK